VVVRAATTWARAPPVAVVERRAVVVRAEPTRARAPPVPALERRAVQAPPTQVRPLPVAALERGVLVTLGPSGLARVRWGILN